MLDKITGKAVQGQRYYNLQYNVCLEKGSDDIGSAVCDTIYTVYLSLCTQTADSISSEPFPRHILYLSLGRIFSLGEGAGVD